jgi:hypothetical protein
MSILDAFARMRLYRKRAAEFDSLSDSAPTANVRRRYRTIAAHYRELADSEEQSDKARMAERLKLLRLRRLQAALRPVLAIQRRADQSLQPESTSAAPQSSSTSRLPAGAFGFLILTQWNERSDR